MSKPEKEPRSRQNTGTGVPMSPDTQPCLIVGIDVSAGGLKAFKSFFSRMPLDTCMAFVLVPHRSAIATGTVDYVLLPEQMPEVFEPVSKKWCVYRRIGPLRPGRVNIPITTAGNAALVRHANMNSRPRMLTCRA